MRQRRSATRIHRRSPPGPLFRWGAALLLGVGGYLLNLFPIGLSPGTDLIFGGVAYLTAAVALGPLPGLLAACIASLRTLWLWNHPYALMTFGAEAFVVGLLVTRRGYRPIIADLLYWLFVGVPLLLLLYHGVLGLRGSTAAVIFLKQPLNGLVDALLVEMLLLVPVVRQALRISRSPRLQSSLAVVVAIAAVVPALAFGVWMGQREWDTNVRRADDRVVLFAQTYASKLQQYVDLHEQAVRIVAQAAESRGEFNVEQLNRLVVVEREQFPGFVSVLAADSRGRVVAVQAHAEKSGGSLPALDLSDRPYFDRLRDNRETVVTRVSADQVGSGDPQVLIAHPIVLADTFAGFVLGALDLRALPRPNPMPARAERLRVMDAGGSLVFDTRSGGAVGGGPATWADSVAYAAVQGIERVGTTTYSTASTNAAPAVTASRVLAGVARIPELGWWVWMEEPYAEIQGYVAEAYVRLFGLLIVVTLLVLLASMALSRYLARPLLRLRAAAAALAGGELRARVGLLPSAVPAEVVELGRGFDEMAEALAGRAHELEELGEIARSLASTLELDELLRRITDAVVRLVGPDGCAIALLTAEGATLRTADYAVGLLQSTAGKEVPLEGSLVGRVAREGTPVLIYDTTADPHVLGEYLDPDSIRSVIGAPLMGRSGPLGALVAVRARRSPHPFDTADLRLLDRLARNAAVAVENARLLEAAEAASRAKSDFLATMSHELRTPLNAVLGHLELLELGVHGAVNSRQQTALERIRTATRHLRGLIEEVLSFAQLEAGRVEVRLTTTDLCAIAHEVATVMEPLAQEKGLKFLVHCAGGGAQVVETDPDKIRQILINLAGNAVKFTDQGEVSICVEPAAEEMVVSVRDTGIGISPQDQVRLFRPFEQLETGLSRPHGGTGLGLYLSRQYARLIGGHIELRSEVGKGSDFSLILPRLEPSRGSEDEAAAAEMLEAPPDPAPGSGERGG